MKLGKELKLDLFTNYKTKIGTVNNKKPQSLYLVMSAWGQIDKIDENVNYNYFLSGLRKKIKQKLNKNLDKDFFFNDKYIVDLDMRTSGFKIDKRSFMSCEITLFQKQSLPITQPTILEKSKNVIYDIVYNCLNKNKYFTFYKTKKIVPKIGYQLKFNFEGKN